MAPTPGALGRTAPDAATVRLHEEAARRLPALSPEERQDAERGLLAREPEVVVTDDRGRVLWDTARYAFLEGDAPPSVHPGLWRHAQLTRLHGLFEVAPGVYQVRGYDLANLTLIEGEAGWIVVDPLTVRETAAAALAFAEGHLGARPVRAVVFTHSHIDHFGGVLGVLPETAEASPNVEIVAPVGFLEHASRENLLAGSVMARRAAFMFGSTLRPAPRGHVGSGLGLLPAPGHPAILAPTLEITGAPEARVLDGVRIEFLLAPDSEAPVELAFYLPAARALCIADLGAHSMHNLYTLRGAPVRDALRWAEALDRALSLFPEVEVVFGSHHWPVFGNARAREFLAAQRDLYRYIHDQTLRLAGNGLTPDEIAEEIELPESLRGRLDAQGYYGSLRQNARAVYQRYFGAYDGNPAHLDPLPPEEAAARYVEAMGGAGAVLEKAREALTRGEHRWAATLLDHLVFAEPGHGEARQLLAQVYEQLGYQAESAPWRNAYLTAAQELRQGIEEEDEDRLERAMDLLAHVPVEHLFEVLATRLHGPRADGKHLRVNVHFTDLERSFVLEVSHAVLHHAERPLDPEADATLRVTHSAFLRLVTRRAGLRDLLSHELDVEGSRTAVLGLLRLLEPPDERFPIVTP